jgi:hypothetical protein
MGTAPRIADRVFRMDCVDPLAPRVRRVPLEPLGLLDQWGPQVPRALAAQTGRRAPPGLMAWQVRLVEPVLSVRQMTTLCTLQRAR